MKRWKRSSGAAPTTDHDVPLVLTLAGGLGIFLGLVAAWDSSPGSFTDAMAKAVASIDPGASLTPFPGGDSRIQPGQIVVAGIPAGFHVRVDGLAYSSGPEKDLVIPAVPGAHRVEVVSRQGDAWVTRVMVEEGGSVLTRPGLFGEVVVEAAPGVQAPGDVYLDGRRLGPLPAFTDSAAVGDHLVEIRSDSGTVWQSRLTVRNAAVTRVEIPGPGAPSAY